MAEATLHLKGVTLRAKDASRDLNHSINLCAEELGRQVKRHRDKRRKRRESAPPRPSPQLPPAAAALRRRARGPAAISARLTRPGRPRYPGVMTILDRALRMGEAKKFKQYAKRVGASTRSSPSSSSSTTRSCASRPTSCASAPADGESLDDLLPERFALVARGRQAHDGHAPLRRAADRRHGPPRRRDRRDEDRRGQDAHRRRSPSSSTRWPARASTSSPSTTTSPAATPSG